MLVFQENIREQICIHAKLEYPGECCGIMLGRRSNGQKIACRIIQTDNMISQAEKSTHFMINPLEIVQAEIWAEEHGLEVIGFYHSHPDCEAVASKEDMLHMIEGYSYPIISVKKGRCVEMNSFEKILQTDTEANEEEILIKEKSYADFGIHISGSMSIK